VFIVGPDATAVDRAAATLGTPTDAALLAT
jgi:hypothetical protein